MKKIFWLGNKYLRELTILAVLLFVCNFASAELSRVFQFGGTYIPNRKEYPGGNNQCSCEFLAGINLQIPMVKSQPILLETGIGLHQAEHPNLMLTLKGIYKLSLNENKWETATLSY